jgi:2-methylisocitrate lyase-like PEP mutase family enzyme
MSQDRDKQFHAMHAGGPLLVLPNAWDAGSARVIETSGARAIATSSAAVSWAHGYPDGQHFAGDALVRAVAEIARVIRVPLSVDVEAGYSADAEGVAAPIAAVIDAGAVGINLEDGASPDELLAAKIAVAKRVGARAGIDLFVNARTDVYLKRLVPAERAVEETLRRAQRYRDAGCDGLFVPGVTAADDIRAIAAGAQLPLNVLVVPGLPPVDELGRLGVRRLSAGEAVCRVALTAARRSVTELLETGRYGAFDDTMSYAETNRLFG